MKALRKWTAAAGVAALLVSSTATVAYAQEVVVVRPPPPPLRVESVPAERAGYVWTRGHWRWDGRAYAWVPGHWRGVGPACPPGMHPGPHGHRCFR